MKHAIFFGILSAVIASCDFVTLPIPEPVKTPIDTSTVFPTIDTSSLNVSTRKILVEEFTGHSCTGCPDQTSKLLTLQEEEHPEIIVVSYHAGDFAKVTATYPTEMRTSHGDAILDRIYTDLTGYPSAQVNRRNYNGNTIFLAHTQWKNPISEWLEEVSDAAIGITATYSPDLSLFKIRVSIKALSNLTGEHRLVVVTVQDSMISEQLDNGVLIPDYVHRHVVRGSVNAEENMFGEIVISDAGIPANEWIDKTYSYPKPETVTAPENCYFIAYLIHSASGEIIQSEECHVHVE